VITSSANARRTYKMVSITLLPEVLARLDVLARERGLSRSGAIADLVRVATRLRGRVRPGEL
jgi:metal-responsive CopG/Arc/MetJ family transcriptional regulator